MVMAERMHGAQTTAPTRKPASRLRVLHMVSFLSADGGAERMIVGLVSHFPKDRIEPWVCAPRGGDREAQADLAEAGVPFVDLGRRRKRDYYHYAKLGALLRRERFDVLHTHLFASNLWGTLAGWAARVPVLIAHEHTWSYEGDPVRVWLDGQVIGRLATQFLTDCAADARKMVEIENVPAEKVKVMPTAHIPRPVVSAVELRAELGLPHGTPLVGTAAVFRPQKALQILVEAFERVLGRVPDAHLVLAGRGPCRGQLEQQAANLGIAHRVHFIGRRTDIDAILPAFDVAVMSSDYEGTPLFALECMASRTPLVATAVGGLPDVIEDGSTGLLVPRRDPERLADALASLLLDAERRSEMGIASAARLNGYTIETRSAQCVELYERLALEAGIH